MLRYQANFSGEAFLSVAAASAFLPSGDGVGNLRGIFEVDLAIVGRDKHRRVGRRTAFIRIHRSTIVTLARVAGLELQSSGDDAVVLRSGHPLRLSRRYRKALQITLDAARLPRSR